MTPHRRRAYPGGSQFTFAPDGHSVEYDAWAERIRGGNGYFGKSDDLKFGAWSRGAQEKVVVGSATPSPPLWKKAGSPGKEAPGRYVDRETYPTTRTRDIARYRQEMLDMVKDLPESGYELSLRDMVVHPETPPRTPPRKAEVETPVNGKCSPEKETKAAGKDRIGMEKGVKQLSRSETWGPAASFSRCPCRLPLAAAAGGGRSHPAALTAGLRCRRGPALKWRRGARKEVTENGGGTMSSVAVEVATAAAITALQVIVTVPAAVAATEAGR